MLLAWQTRFTVRVSTSNVESVSRFFISRIAFRRPVAVHPA